MGIYNKKFRIVWEKLEQCYSKGKIKPQQENDITCYLYHVLLNDGIQPIKIWTEDTINVGKKKCYIDMNINDRLLVEIRLMKPKYHTGFSTFAKKIEKLSSKLKKSSRRVKRCHKRQPIVALWNWKEEPIDKTLTANLKKLKKDLKRKYEVYLIWGPKCQCN
ncbi:MAG: hypothetical protein AB1349_03970 [Elusimicrobiota bacterium]